MPRARASLRAPPHSVPLRLAVFHECTHQNTRRPIHGRAHMHALEKTEINQRRITHKPSTNASVQTKTRKRILIIAFHSSPFNFNKLSITVRKAR